MMKTLGVIPARGGSKGVPRKNIRHLGGKPLLQYTAEAALAARSLARVILTTDDEEIAEIGARCGLEVPFLRPAELARDDTPMLPVVQHAVRWVENQGQFFDAVCLLQPTNPLRRGGVIDACVRMLETENADAVMTVLPVPTEFNPHWVYFRNDDGTLRISTGGSTPIGRRQDLPLALHREGSVYVTRRNVLLEENSLYGNRLCCFPLEREGHVNVDTMDDWRLAESFLTR